jgi:hypothetical protein
LAGKRRNQNPIKQAEIKLEIIFQKYGMRTRRMTRRAHQRKPKVRDHLA